MVHSPLLSALYAIQSVIGEIQNIFEGLSGILLLSQETHSPLFPFS